MCKWTKCEQIWLLRKQLIKDDRKQKTEKEEDEEIVEANEKQNLIYAKFIKQDLTFAKFYS